jgi:GNAT superfamily N-acetyltransferase
MASPRDPAQVKGKSRREEGVRVLVCGGRDYENAEALHQFMDELAQRITIVAVTCANSTRCECNPTLVTTSSPTEGANSRHRQSTELRSEMEANHYSSETANWIWGLIPPNGLMEVTMYALSTPASEPVMVVPPKLDQSAERVFATLTLAFAADPPCRWLYPQPEQYLKYFPVFARAFGGIALAHGTVLADHGGAALWLAPGAEPEEEALVALVEESVVEPRRQEAMLLFAEMGRVHPHEPHWYLPLIGVEPDCQGRGLGSALIRPVLERCDAAGLPAYLEATSARSVTLYERLGFEAVGAIQVGGCPVIVPMLRRPQ